MKNLSGMVDQVQLHASPCAREPAFDLRRDSK